MPSLVLFLEEKPTCVKVKSFSELPPSIECACLVSCSSLCLFLESDSDRVTMGENGVVLQSIATGDLKLGSNGAICLSHQSATLMDVIADEGASFECLVSNIEGVLDDGLVLGQDIRLLEALPFRQLSGPDRAFLASENLDKNGYWCFVLEVQRDAVGRLLSSATMGYLLGFRMKDSREKTIARLVRCAGYDDGETDLLLSIGGLKNSSDLLATF